MKMIQEAKSKPINLDDDIKPKVLALINKTLERYGLLSFEEEKWAKHKKIINFAFHLDILKVFLLLNLDLYVCIITLSLDFRI
ncbi:hypothetical protein ACS0TY_026609 [Phlomoides rotata]